MRSLRYRFIVLLCAATLALTYCGLFGSNINADLLLINHVKQEGLEHLDMHVYGFVLSDVFLHHATKNNEAEVAHMLTQRLLLFNKNLHLDRCLTTMDLSE